MEGVCIGKCIPKGDGLRNKSKEESEEIHLLREQVRDLSEMNLALRRELQAMQVTNITRAKIAEDGATDASDAYAFASRVRRAARNRKGKVKQSR
eukprot:symbB.v1.2.008396.t1/scaffold525.1/size192214/21